VTGTRVGKKRQEGKNKIPPLNPALKLMKPRESSVEESGRLPAHCPSDRQRLAFLAGGNNQDEGDCWDQAVTVSQVTWLTSEPGYLQRYNKVDPIH
jgi:hypothetical protein